MICVRAASLALTDEENVMRILVTGASGKFGPTLLQFLKDAGHSLRVMVHESEPDGPWDEAVKGDITDAGAVQGACLDMDAVCHLATVKGKPGFMHVNVGGLHNLLDACRRMTRRPKIVHLSGDNVLPIYDYPMERPADECTEYLFVDDQYGLTKVLEEVTVQQFRKKYNLPVFTLRSSFIMEGRRSVNMWHPSKGGFKAYLSKAERQSLERGERFLVVPHDKQGRPLKRHVVDPRDLAGAFVHFLTREDCYGEIINIAGPGPFDYAELALFLKQELDLPVHDITVPDAHSFEIDIGKAKRFGFEPRYSMQETLERALQITPTGSQY
jgi:nucleoside-diphosphate-sugar epimerase